MPRTRGVREVRYSRRKRALPPLMVVWARGSPTVLCQLACLWRYAQGPGSARDIRVVGTFRGVPFGNQRSVATWVASTTVNARAVHTRPAEYANRAHRRET